MGFEDQPFPSGLCEGIGRSGHDCRHDGQTRCRAAASRRLEQHIQRRCRTSHRPAHRQGEEKARRSRPRRDGSRRSRRWTTRPPARLHWPSRRSRSGAKPIAETKRKPVRSMASDATGPLRQPRRRWKKLSGNTVKESNRSKEIARRSTDEPKPRRPAGRRPRNDWTMPCAGHGPRAICARFNWLRAPLWRRSAARKKASPSRGAGSNFVQDECVRSVAAR